MAAGHPGSAPAVGDEVVVSPGGHEPFSAQLRPLDALASLFYFGIGLGVLSAPLLVVERQRANISANFKRRKERDKESLHTRKKRRLFFFLLASD